MSIISALTSQSDTQKPGNSFDAQIRILERRIDAGVKNGTITSDQADQITTALDAIKQTIEDVGGEDRLIPGDKGQISKLLRDISRAVAGEPQTTAGAVENDGDGDDGIGFSTIV